MEVIVGISNRHVHLNKEDYNILFGSEEMHNIKDLVQPGQFSSDKKVTIKNGDREIKNVRVLGPIRSYTQVEISRTDSYFLKVNPPIRTSGDLDSASILTIIGPKGEITKPCGIIANRHIHISPEEVKKYGLEDTKYVKVKVNGEKGGILNNVHLKVLEPSKLELHLDTDDGNGFNLKTGDTVEFDIDRN